MLKNSWKCWLWPRRIQWLQFGCGLEAPPPSLKTSQNVVSWLWNSCYAHTFFAKTSLCFTLFFVPWRSFQWLSISLSFPLPLLFVNVQSLGQPLCKSCARAECRNHFPLTSLFCSSLCENNSHVFLSNAFCLDFLSCLSAFWNLSRSGTTDACLNDLGQHGL